MPATYPTSIKSFTPKQDRVDIVEAIDVDELQLEIAALETTLGVNPHLSSVYGDYLNVSSRLAASDALLNTIHGYFGSGGTITEAQVVNLVANLTTLTTGVANAATSSALSSAVATINASISSEAGTRAGADNSLASSINSLSGSTTASVNSLQTQINNEASTRASAVSGEATTRLGADNALASRVAVLEAQFKTCETEYANSSARNYGSSSGYQNLYLPNQSYLTNDFGSSINGHNTVGFSSTQTRFYTDFPPSASLWAVTIVVTIQSNATGVRGVRLVTAGGSTLAELIKAANDDVGDETISVSWIGRLSRAPSYFVYPQVLQNSGSTLAVRANTSSTPTAMYFTRIPG